MKYTCEICGKQRPKLTGIGAHLQCHFKGIKKELWHLYVKELDEPLKGTPTRIKNLKKKTKRKTKSKQYKKVLSSSFYNSKEWRKVRYQALTIHGNNCMACGSSPEDGIVIHVDHIKPKSKFPELALDVDNLQILCADCNLGKSNIDDTDWRASEEAKSNLIKMDEEFYNITRH